MIKVEFLKNKLLENNEEKMLITIAKSVVDISQERKKLNLCFALDISSSMNLIINNNELNDNSYKMKMLNIDDYSINSFIHNQSNNKLSKSIEALKIALEKMDEGDYFSLVLFNQTVHNFISPVRITKENKNEIMLKLNQIKANGNTNLYEGWFQSTKNVAENLNSQYINRVILITDGETNSGLMDTTKIVNNIRSVYENTKISTTCFGIGDSFNEDLLEKISENGSGNFYYINNSKIVSALLISEYQSLNSTIGTNVKLKVKFNKDIKEFKNINNFVGQEDYYILTDIINNKEKNILFTFKNTLSSSVNKDNICSIELSYENNGEKHIVKNKIKMQTTNKSEYETLLSNENILVIFAKAHIANNQRLASEHFRTGDFNNAKKILNETINQYKNSNLSKDSAINTLLASCVNTTENINLNNVKDMTKILRSQSYNSRYD